jgi:hypothetical protein
MSRVCVDGTKPPRHLLTTCVCLLASKPLCYQYYIVSGAAYSLLTIHSLFLDLQNSHRFGVDQVWSLCSTDYTSLRVPLPLTFFSTLHSCHGKEKITGGELMDGAISNGYQEGPHRDKYG